MPIVKLPDGTKVKMPDNMTEEQMNHVIKNEIWPSILEKKRLSSGMGGFIKNVSETLPIVGSMAGGIVGGAGGTLSPTAPVTAPAGAILGAGLGATGGGFLRDIIQKYLLGMEVPETLSEKAVSGGKDFFLGAGGEGIAQTPVMIAKKILSPTVGKVTPEILEQISKYKIPLRPTSMLENVAGAPMKRAKFFEWLGGKTMPSGKYWMIGKAQKLPQIMRKMADDVIDTLPVPKTDIIESGQKLGLAIEKAGKEFHKKTQLAYKVWKKVLGPDPLDMRETLKVIRDRAKFIKGGLGKLIKKNQLRSKTHWTPEELVDFQANLKSLHKNDRDIWFEITAAFRRDIGDLNWNVLSGTGKKAFKMMKAFQNNPSIRLISRKYETRPDLVIKEIMRAGNIEDVQYIKSIIDKDTWNIVRSQFIEGLVDRATVYSGNKGIFMPGKFADEFFAFGKQVKNVIPERYENIKNFARISRMAAEDMEKAVGGGALAKAWDIAMAGMGNRRSYDREGRRRNFTCFFRFMDDCKIINEPVRLVKKIY